MPRQTAFSHGPCRSSHSVAKTTFEPHTLGLDELGSRLTLAFGARAEEGRFRPRVTAIAGGLDASRAFALTWLWGVAMALVVTRWLLHALVVQYGASPLPSALFALLLIGALALVPATLAAGFARLSPRLSDGMAPLAFAALWTFAMASILIWLSGRWAIVLLLVLPVLMSVTVGQVDLLIAAAIVVGFRYPAAWAVPILTKVTPGISLLWFAARGEWRSLVIALGATVAIVGISYAIDPDAWWGWLGMPGRGEFPTSQDGWFFDVPLGWRLPIAAAIVVWGARTDRPWTVPFGCTLALPILWPSGFAILAACLPLAGLRGAWRRPQPRQAATVDPVVA